jgi:hypothetical protein
MLLEQGDGWIQTKVYEDAFEAFVHFQPALSITIYVVLDLGRAEHIGRGDVHARWTCDILI